MGTRLSSMAMGSSICERWILVQGSHLWEVLTDPPNYYLHKNILIYGNHSEATYDAFIRDLFSKYAISCKYRYRRLFDDVILTKGPVEW